MVKLTLVDGGEEWVNPAQVTRVCKDTRWAGEKDQDTHVHIRGEPVLVVEGTPEEIVKRLSTPAAPIVVNVANADDPNRVAAAFQEVLDHARQQWGMAPSPP